MKPNIGCSNCVEWEKQFNIYRDAYRAQTQNMNDHINSLEKLNKILEEKNWKIPHYRKRIKELEELLEEFRKGEQDGQTERGK